MAEIKKLFPEIKEDQILKSSTSINVGGPAKFFYQAKTIQELIKIVKVARREKIPHLILGGGSNLIISDQGYDGLVIENRTDQMEINGNQVMVDSGVFLDNLIRNLAQQGCNGLEFLTGIPGTVGGAIVNNAEAWGIEITDKLVSLAVLDVDNKEKIFYPKDIKPAYRKTNFKGQTEGIEFPVVLRAVLKITKSTVDQSLRKMDEYRKIKNKNQPKGFSAGCIFCNPKVGENAPEEWQDKIKDDRISAGFLLDEAGLKNSRLGHAYVSSEHANFIINRKKAKSQDIKDLSDKMKKAVKKKYGINLTREVEFVGVFE